MGAGVYLGGVGMAVALLILAIVSFTLYGLCFPTSGKQPLDSEEPEETPEEWAREVSANTTFPQKTVLVVLDVMKGNRGHAAAICEACSAVGENPIASARTLAELIKRGRVE